MAYIGKMRIDETMTVGAYQLRLEAVNVAEQEREGAEAEVFVDGPGVSKSVVLDYERWYLPEVDGWLEHTDQQKNVGMSEPDGIYISILPELEGGGGDLSPGASLMVEAPRSVKITA